MPAQGRPWRTMQAKYREDCKQLKLPCWICNGDKGPINYWAKAGEPSSFTADHVAPTSLGGDKVRLENLKPAHHGCNSSRGNTTRGMFPTSRQW
jgi:5-methylcytosine-specific restriction endonuclease McrA